MLVLLRDDTVSEPRSSCPQNPAWTCSSFDNKFSLHAIVAIERVDPNKTHVMISTWIQLHLSAMDAERYQKRSKVTNPELRFQVTEYHQFFDIALKLEETGAIGQDVVFATLIGCSSHSPVQRSILPKIIRAIGDSSQSDPDDFSLWDSHSQQYTTSLGRRRSSIQDTISWRKYSWYSEGTYDGLDHVSWWKGIVESSSVQAAAVQRNDWWSFDIWWYNRWIEWSMEIMNKWQETIILII